MESVKVHLLATVLLTQMSALIWGKVPYFPIEVSRTAASGPIPLTIFRTGIVSIIVTLFITKSLSVQTVMVWLALSIICLFDDVNYWLIHMSGLLGLILVSLYSVYARGKSSIAPFLMALTIYGLRNVMKACLIALVETNPKEFDGIFSRQWLRFQFNRHMAIMYQGESACLYPEFIMPAFKISAVLQWVLLYALSFCF
jgi:hypothetical protein